jgi:hypothetical protein
MNLKDINLVLKFQPLLAKIDSMYFNCYICDSRSRAVEILYRLNDDYKYLISDKQGNIETVIKKNNEINFYSSKNKINSSRDLVSHINEINHDLDFPYTLTRGDAVEAKYVSIKSLFINDNMAMDAINKYYLEVDQWRNGKIFDHNWSINI